MLERIPDLELEESLLNLAAEDRIHLQRILEHVQEVDRRGLYLRRAKPSLFAYLTDIVGFSPASAQRRINAARLGNTIPDLLDRVGQGKLSLDQIAVVRRGLRRKDASIESQRELLEKVQAAPPGDAERIVAEHLDLPLVKKSHVQVQKDGSVRLSVTVSKETWEMLQRCREILAHKAPTGELVEVLENLCDTYLEKNDPLRKSGTAGPEAAARNKESPFRRISPALRHYIFQRDRSCQFFDPVTKRRCGSRYQLEIDHLWMRSRGGSNHPDNLRLLCRAHNQHLAREAAKKKVGPSG
jgi:hypothetical protein